MERQEFNKILKAYTKAADSAMSLGNYAIAERFYLDALRFAERRFGENSNETAFTYFSLSMFYVSANMHEKARDAANKALEILKQSVGIEHPTTAIALYHLNQICETQGLGAIENAFAGPALESLKQFVKDEEERQRSSGRRSQEPADSEGGPPSSENKQSGKRGGDGVMSFEMLEPVPDTMHGADH